LAANPKSFSLNFYVAKHSLPEATFWWFLESIVYVYLTLNNPRTQKHGTASACFNFIAALRQVYLNLFTKKLKTMKTTILKISFIFLLLSIMVEGCKKDEYGDNNLIVKELPAFYIGYNLKAEEIMIISDQSTFDKVFTKELLAQTSILQDIDFSKYNVLAGQSSIPSGFATWKNKFCKLEKNSYLYQLKVSYEEVGVPLNFCYGIIVNKLPSEANVKFEISRINE
jgi:hypothetical protein